VPPERDRSNAEIRPRPFWSGTITFGLVAPENEIEQIVQRNRDAWADFRRAAQETEEHLERVAGLSALTR
jgi:hypothetical protein